METRAPPRSNGVAASGDYGADDELDEQNSVVPTNVTYEGSPDSIHRFRHDRSILALAVTSTCIYAGTQAGEILVRFT